MHIHTNLEFLRSKYKLSYRELAKQTGVGFSTIKKIESKYIVDPRILTLLKLAEFFNISINDFINTDLTKNIPVTGTKKSWMMNIGNEVLSASQLKRYKQSGVILATPGHGKPYCISIEDILKDSKGYIIVDPLGANVEDEGRG